MQKAKFQSVSGLDSKIELEKKKKRAETNLALFMIDHNIMRLHISMHNASAMTKVQRLQQLINVEADIKVREAWV